MISTIIIITITIIKQCHHNQQQQQQYHHHNHQHLIIKHTYILIVIKHTYLPVLTIIATENIKCRFINNSYMAEPRSWMDDRLLIRYMRMIRMKSIYICTMKTSCSCRSTTCYCCWWWWWWWVKGKKILMMIWIIMIMIMMLLMLISNAINISMIASWRYNIT